MKKQKTTASKTAANNDKRKMILWAILPEIAFDGWSSVALDRAVKATGATRGEIDLLFPQGIRDLIELFGTVADTAMQQAVAEEPGFARLRVREKIAFVVQARLKFLQPHREAVRRMMFWYAMPFHMHLGFKRLYKTVDLMWRLAGDAATDFNFYTKRALLAGVLKATMLFWLDDETPDCTATNEFLDRRIAEVMKAGKSISLMKEWKPSELMDVVKSRLKKTT